ncbi:MAG: hypothetical protein P1V34_11020, partial [Alphaproteobacteria bacterium]|nr:hypothetical protein [Alphaproteobacteria bacterium]
MTDKTRDLFSTTDANRSTQDRTNTSDSATEGSNEARFAQILKGRIATSFSTSRANQQFKLPEKATTNEPPTPIYNRRDDRSRDQSIDDNEQRDDRSQDDRPAPVAHAPVEPAQRRDTDMGTVKPVAEAKTGNGANENTAPAQADKGAPQASDAKANTAATQSNGAAKETQQAAASQVVKGETVSPEILEQAKKAAQNAGGKLTATVTDEAVQVSSQPQNTLTAKAAINADAANGEMKKGQATALANTQAEGEAEAEADASANNIFNRIKAEAKNPNAQNNANAVKNGVDPSKVNAAAQQAAAIANSSVNTQ